MRFRESLVPVFVTLALLACKNESKPAAPAAAQAAAPSTELAGVTYVAINPSVFVPQATIDGWINAKPINQAAIDAHRWTLWQGMTAPSGQTLNGTPLPVWETWYDTTTVFANATLPPNLAASPLKTARLADLTNINEKRRFMRPDQLVKHSAARKTLTGAQLSGSVLAFNRFTQEMRDHIWMNHYYDSTVLTNINSGFSASTPITQRTIKAFPDHSMMMKPVFRIASATQPVMMPYWNGLGTNATTDPTNPTPDTWKQCVLLDPTGTARNNQARPCNKQTIAAGQYQVVPINEDPSKSGLYAFKLTQAEADQLNTLLGPDVGPLFGIQPPLKAGDFAVFVASHVATREIENWTWQTFWYSPNPSTLPSDPPAAQAAPASITAPWNHYVSCTAYYMVTPPNDPNGQQSLCYNPYLETGLSGLDNKDQTSTNGVGVQTNCMTCHRAAVWNPSIPRNPGPPYAIDFNLDASNPTWFANVTKTEFSWATQANAHTAPFNPPPK